MEKKVFKSSNNFKNINIEEKHVRFTAETIVNDMIQNQDSEKEDFNKLDFNNLNLNEDIIESDSEESIDPELEDINSKLSKIYYRFMNKYEHLDNVKNKILVKEIIKMAIDNLPESDNIDYYLNFIESSIKHFTN